MSNISINELSTGVDSDGMLSYIEDLKAVLITETIGKIDNIDAIDTAIKNGWQGVARDRFLTDFADARTSVKEDLEKEYKNLNYRLDELQSQYFQADLNMIDE